MPKHVLKTINDNGYEAYIVGGFVRDKLLNRVSYDVDIATNALVSDLLKMFDNVEYYDEKYGVVKFKDEKYSYEITTYRQESCYQSHRELLIDFVNKKEIDAKRRDFTINALYQDVGGNLYDPYNGVEDLENRIIRCIGNIEEKFRDDPLRILRCIRISTILDFEIEDNLLKFIKENAYLVKNISKERILEELTKILLSSNCHKALKLLKENNYLNYMAINYDKIVYVSDINGMYAQIDFIEDYPISKKDKEIILAIKEIINRKNIDNLVLFKYGYELCKIAAIIIGIDLDSLKEIYFNLPLKTTSELNITIKDIHDILNISYNKSSYLYEEIIRLILSGKLKNDKKDIIDYINRK